MDKKIGNSVIRLVRGDITKQEVDAIVNAANTTLLGGGGVDGAIHRAGGPEILKECKLIGGCPTGGAKITTGGNLAAKYVIHTVGPVWAGGSRGEADLLASAYRKSLEAAVENGVSAIAFPSISTGAYRFPIEQASRIALGTVAEFIEDHQSIKEVVFALFSQDDLAVYEQAMQEV